MKVNEVIAESFAYDYAEPYGIFEPEDFIEKIKDWVSDDPNFVDAFLLATEGLQEEWPELHDQVCAILKPYALRFLLKIAKNENIPGSWEVDEYFNHWMELIHTELKPNWPELAKISAVANRAFDYHKKPSVTESFSDYYAKPLNIHNARDFLKNIAEWAAKDFEDAFILAKSGLYQDYPEQQAQVAEILKPYALRYVLSILKMKDNTDDADAEDDFLEWLDKIRAVLDVDWPELKQIETVAKKAFAHGKTESLSEAPSMADEDAIFNSLHYAKRGDAGLAVYQIFHRVEDANSAEQLPVEADEKRAINKYKDVYVKGLLQWIRGDFSEGENDWNTISLVIRYLQHNGINWPEFKVMQQALVHNENK